MKTFTFRATRHFADRLQERFGHTPLADKPESFFLELLADARAQVVYRARVDGKLQRFRIVKFAGLGFAGLGWAYGRKGEILLTTILTDRMVRTHAADFTSVPSFRGRL